MARNRTAGCKRAPIPARLRSAIESERGTLLKAESVLNCLAISMEYANEEDATTHYPDVARLACDLLRQSIDGLDSLTLARLIQKRVKEDTRAAHERLCIDWDASYAERTDYKANCLLEAVTLAGSPSTA